MTQGSTPAMAKIAVDDSGQEFWRGIWAKSLGQRSKVPPSTTAQHQGQIAHGQFTIQWVESVNYSYINNSLTFMKGVQ
jgi:hypothetical protein